MSDVWYFACGSNLSQGRKQIRTGLIRRAIRAKLPDYRLVFNKKGVMDGHYGRTPVTVEMEDGSLCNAEMYVAGDEFVVPEKSPPQDYLEHTVIGANEHQLPDEYIAKSRQVAGTAGGAV
ncbi:MAG: gamma-glutamylcyclotransferase family protein [Planctomyces sp.]